MQGFFENQYLSYKKNHIKNLLALAKADGHMHEKEIALLFKLGKKYNLKEWQVQNLIDSEEKYEIDIPNNHNDKMNLLYDLILMVYADEKVEKREIEFCEGVAKKFGLKKDIVQLLLKVFDRGLPPSPDEWDDLRKDAKNKYALK